MVDLTRIPAEPGCYLYKDKDKKIIYVGKAKNLKKRVSSYFQKQDHDPKTQILLSHIDDVETIVTKSEVEALLLENTLIKKHTPKYNINLKDSKSYAYLRLTNEKFPRLLLARDKKKDGKYFGPFVSGREREIIKRTLQRTFKIRTCRRLPKRPCLRYHIKLCDAPCIGNIDEETYNERIAAAESVLKGKSDELIKTYQQKMMQASETQEFERALEYRNIIESLENIQQRQYVENHARYNEDIISYKEYKDDIYILLFNIHKGVLVNKREFIFDAVENAFEDFLKQHYLESPIPNEIILPNTIDPAIKEALENRAEKNVKIHVPKLGRKKELLDLVEKNIDLTFFGDIRRLEILQKDLQLNEIPKVIECFDISHLQGKHTVASMVQFSNGRPDKSNYRRYKIRTVEGIDDFASMKEVVTRRYSRLLDQGGELPDLIVIDGGKGQLSSAIQAMKEAGVKIPMISIAKKFEEIYVPGKLKPHPVSHDGLQLLRAIRDEAHRFAITYNRLLRSKEYRDELLEE